MMMEFMVCGLFHVKQPPPRTSSSGHLIIGGTAFMLDIEDELHMTSPCIENSHSDGSDDNSEATSPRVFDFTDRHSVWLPPDLQATPAATAEPDRSLCGEYSSSPIE